ncbi:hypothetical protein D3C86_1504940 [compost metagenome]
MRLSRPHALAQVTIKSDRFADTGLRRVQAVVQGRLAPQRGDDLPGGLFEQSIVDVRPHPFAHRPS